MSDLISRQDMLDAIEDESSKGHYSCFASYSDAQKFKQTVNELPSAETDVPDTNVGDMISRQAAIDAVGSMLRRKFGIGGDLAEITLADLPSAQPEIIRCKDCKWYDRDKESSYGYCHAMKHCHYSKHWEISIYRTYNEDFFCADAERG